MMKKQLLGTIVLGFVTVFTACARLPEGEHPKATYDQKTGRLQTLTFDANRNGTIESISHMDGTRIVRIELDLDENGKTDRWDFYRPDRQLEKIGFSRLNDGVMDARVFYQAEGGLARIEVSTRRDGRFDRTEFYRDGVLDRTADDTNGDGQPDKWETYRPLPNAGPGEPAYAITSSAFDDTGSGRPERRFIYGPGGVISRVEVDSDGDGTFTPLQANTRIQ